MATGPIMEPISRPAGEEPAGDAGVEAVIAANETALLRYATRLLTSADLAQDVVQTAFIRLAQQWDESRAWTGDRVRHWLFRAAHNAAVDVIRKEERLKKLHEAQAAELDPADPPQQATALDVEDRRRVALEMLAQLPDSEREVMILRLQHGLSYAEIGEITGRSEGNVGCLLSNATRELTRLLKKAGVIGP
jgi:RNA polymerase sigma factor (sigma-70 family)